MIWNWILGKEWQSLDDAFYSKLPINPLRGSYWSWLIQGFKENPKIWLLVSFLGVKNTVNGVTTHDGYRNDGNLNTLMGSWFVKNNKVTDFFLERSLTIVNKNSLMSKSRSGFELKLHGKHPNYVLTLENKGDRILECKSNSLEFDVEPVRHKKKYGTKSYWTSDKKSYWFLSDNIRLPVLTRATNLFTNVDCKFLGDKFRGITYAERANCFGPPIPWKYGIFDFEDGSRFRFFFAYKNIFKTHYDLTFTFDCASTNKKYYFEDMHKTRYFYLDQNMKNSHLKFCPKSEFIVIKSENENREKIELVAKIKYEYVYKYRKWLLYENYHQLILELEKINLFEGGKEVDIDTKNTIGYGEYVNITLK